MFMLQRHSADTGNMFTLLFMKVFFFIYSVLREILKHHINVYKYVNIKITKKHLHFAQRVVVMQQLKFYNSEDCTESLFTVSSQNF